MSSPDLYAAVDIASHRHSNSGGIVSFDGSGDFLVFSDPSYRPLPFVNSSSSFDERSKQFCSPNKPLFLSSISHSSSSSSSTIHVATTYPLLFSSNDPEFDDLSALLQGSSGSDDQLEKSQEECHQMGVVDHTHHINQTFLPDVSYSPSPDVSVSECIQNSSSTCNSFPLEAAYSDTPMMDNPIFQSPAHNSFFTAQHMSRTIKENLTSPKEATLLSEANFKTGRCSAEEKIQKILKYKAKRSLRKFNKTIKYACRKTLADNRTRIRGRFARNDEINVNPKSPSSIREEDENDQFWTELVEGLNDGILS